MAYGPKKYSDFRVWLENFLAAVQKYKTVLKLPADDVIDLENKVAAYLPIDEAAAKTDAGPVEKQARKDAKAKLDEFISKFVAKNIYPNDAKTDAMLVEMGLPIHKSTYTKREPPKERCAARVTITGALTHKVTVEDEASGSMKKPDDADGFVYRWQLGGEQPADADDLPHSEYNGRNGYVFTWTEKDIGQPVYFAVCYSNSKGRGPLSLVVKTIVAG